MKNFQFLALTFLLQIQLYAQQSSTQHHKHSQPTPPYYNAENLRSDTFNILKYTIELEIGNTSSGPIVTGRTLVKFVPKMNNQPFILLDLLKLIVDSIKENNSILTYVHNDTVLQVNFLTNKNVTDTSILQIYYHGNAKMDPTKAGGVHQDAGPGTTFIYNMGTGNSDPISFGRSWFPCFDNFVERSQFEFAITCDSARKAYCGGTLISDLITGAKRTRRWLLNELIPAYLANFGIAKFAEVKWNINTLTGNKPIILAAIAADTTNMKNAFVNLKSCITGFENYFGPYKWPRFGYCVTSVTVAAMEHATNITYPRSALSISNENLMAHELAHHWWGNLITCETPDDMWINEGFASYAAHLFKEWHYGKQAYLNAIKPRHEDILHYGHHAEAGFQAVTGVSRTLTYGFHVYTRGADVAHNLRTYMGDSAFFAGIKYTMQQKSYQPINSLELRNLMATGGGKNLNNFFNDWVFNGGWSHFRVDSIQYQQVSSGYDAVIFVRQSLYGTTSFHTGVPLEISFFKNDWSRVIQPVLMSGANQSFTLNVPYLPVYSALNFDTKLFDASTHEYKIIKTTGIHNLVQGKISMQVFNKGADSSLLRVVHNFVKPDPFKQINNYKISNQHYWKVEGILSPGFHAKAQFNFNGFKTMFGTYSYLDTLLTQVNGDSILLFYRKDASADWSPVQHFKKTKVNQKSGYIWVDTLKLGEYTFANAIELLTVGEQKNLQPNNKIRVFPNPATRDFKIEMDADPEAGTTLILMNSEGKKMLEKKLSHKSTSVETSNFAKGIYFVTIEDMDGIVRHSQKIFLLH